MGKTWSKEEIVIAQAGNSGGQSLDAENKGHHGYSTTEVLAIVAFILAIAILLFLGYRKMKQLIEKKIRMEIRRSQELI